MIGARVANMRQGERTDIEPSMNSRKVSQMSLGITERHSARLIKEAVRQQIIYRKPGKFGKYYINDAK